MYVDLSINKNVQKLSKSTFYALLTPDVEFFKLILHLEERMKDIFININFC
jgi:hypothetical protein